MIGCLVLSAGASSRMGTPKALLDAGDGRSFVAAIAARAREAGAGAVVVVLGPPHAERIRAALPGDLTVALNPQPELGMLSSVQAGIRALPAVEAALIWPVDIPGVRATTVGAVLAAAPGRIVIPTHGGRGGHPLAIPAGRFAELLALDPSLGLRALVQARPDEVVRLPVDDPGVLVDVDTPDDLDKLTRLV
jgi:molybdenum cofactor cytidylyltransferase